MSKSIVLYLQVHQPLRIKQYTIFDVGHDHHYTNDEGPRETNNRLVFERVADKSYRPMNALLEQLLAQHPQFKLTLSLTGTFIEQAEQWAPDVLDSFKRLVATGRVELLAETYHHSLAFFYSKREFEYEVNLHREKILRTFGVTPTVFRNTELAYSDEVGAWASQRGYKGILAEGWDDTLQWRSPNYLYKAAGTQSLALLLKNYRLSDDLAFRFSNQSWAQWPLTARKYTDWIDHDNDQSPLTNLFMDYETFGEHQWADTGIFSFFTNFVGAWLDKEGNSFSTVSDAIQTQEMTEELSVSTVTTWADEARDLSAWNANALQTEALRHVYALEHEILQTADQTLIDDWRKLLTSDHTYYMSTKWQHDGSVHSYFSPYDSPYDAFLSYINVVRDLRWRISQYRKGL